MLISETCALVDAGEQWLGPAELAGCLVLLASAWKSADHGRGAGGALSWADGRKTGGVVTLLLGQQGHTHRRIHIRHTHTGNIRTTICHSLSFRRRSSFVVGNKPCEFIIIFL